MADERTTLHGSERRAPPGTRVGDADAAETAQVSVYLRPPTPQGEQPLPGEFRSRESLRAEREESLAPAMAQVESFAAEHGLTVVDKDAARRLVRLEGTVGALQQAFGAQLHRYQHEGRSFRARTGPLTAPSAVAGVIEAVLGLDQRPVATPKNVRLAEPDASSGYLPNAVAALYGFPPGDGSGECIGIIELGGGFNPDDTAQAFGAMSLSPPAVVAVPVSGGANQPGQDTDADGEVALDIQVAGAGAPGARIAVYFAPNTDQGFVDAISQAAHDQANAPSVLSISWGSAEAAWTGQSVTAMTSALQDAASLGVTVLAASGDGLATDGVGDGKAHVDFPASSVWVLGCGGTRLQSAGGAVTAETVWNSEGGGTGGGVSDLFSVPSWQTDIALPASVNDQHRGRGVPDVAGDADPETGYRVVVDGQSQVIGGTSAVAPLWSGLFALINAAAGKPSGPPHATLYSNAGAFRDVVKGDNKSGGVGYEAGPGWDACTGLGAPIGDKITALFAAKAAGTGSGSRG
jgi:kumamolisin